MKGSRRSILTALFTLSVVGGGALRKRSIAIWYAGIGMTANVTAPGDVKPDSVTCTVDFNLTGVSPIVKTCQVDPGILESHDYEFTYDESNLQSDDPLCVYTEDVDFTKKVSWNSNPWQDINSTNAATFTVDPGEDTLALEITPDQYICPLIPSGSGKRKCNHNWRTGKLSSQAVTTTFPKSLSEGVAKLAPSSPFSCEILGGIMKVISLAMVMLLLVGSSAMAIYFSSMRITGTITSTGGTAGSETTCSGIPVDLEANGGAAVVIEAGVGGGQTNGTIVL